MNQVDLIQHKLKQMLSLSDELKAVILQPEKADEVVKELLSKLAEVEKLLEDLQTELEEGGEEC